MPAVLCKKVRRWKTEPQTFKAQSFVTEESGLCWLSLPSASHVTVQEASPRPEDSVEEINMRFRMRSLHGTDQGPQVHDLFQQLDLSSS